MQQVNAQGQRYYSCTIVEKFWALLLEMKKLLLLLTLLFQKILKLIAGDGVRSSERSHGRMDLRSCVLPVLDLLRHHLQYSLHSQSLCHLPRSILAHLPTDGLREVSNIFHSYIYNYFNHQRVSIFIIARSLRVESGYLFMEPNVILLFLLLWLFLCVCFRDQSFTLITNQSILGLLLIESPPTLTQLSTIHT